MSHEWTPGDMAMVTGKDDAEVRAMRTDGGGWKTCHGSFFYDYQVNARALAVIDPENREQIEGLEQIYDRVLSTAPKYDGPTEVMQATLREFVGDVTPDEPAHPQARVTDRRDNIWRLLADGDWVCVSGPDIGVYIDWSRLVPLYGPLSVEVIA